MHLCVKYSVPPESVPGIDFLPCVNFPFFFSLSYMTILPFPFTKKKKKRAPEGGIKVQDDTVLHKQRDPAERFKMFV